MKDERQGPTNSREEQAKVSPLNGGQGLGAKKILWGVLFLLVPVFWWAVAKVLEPSEVMPSFNAPVVVEVNEIAAKLQVTIEQCLSEQEDRGSEEQAWLLRHAVYTAGLIHETLEQEDVEPWYRGGAWILENKGLPAALSYLASDAVDPNQMDETQLRLKQRLEALLLTCQLDYAEATRIYDRLLMAQPRWDEVRLDLARILCLQADVNEGENKGYLRQAESHCLAILGFQSTGSKNKIWAQTQQCLGDIYGRQALLKPQMAASLQAKRVAAYREALPVVHREADSYEWIGLQNRLAIALRARSSFVPPVEAVKLLDESVSIYRRLLEGVVYEDEPQVWLTIQSNLAMALRNSAKLLSDDHAVTAQNFAVACYQAVLEKVSQEEDPQAWAATQNNLAVALSELAEYVPQNESLSYLEKAMGACQAALQVRTQKDMPESWAMTQNNLALIQCRQACLSSGFEASQMLRRGIEAYRQALTVYTAEEDPVQRANIQGSLAFWLLHLGRNDEALETANKALRLAPKLDWVQLNRAHALLFLGRYAEAEAVYQQFCNDSSRGQAYAQTVLDDFDSLEAFGANHINVSRIRKLMNEVLAPTP